MVEENDAEQTTVRYFKYLIEVTAKQFGVKEKNIFEMTLRKVSINRLKLKIEQLNLSIIKIADVSDAFQ